MNGKYHHISRILLCSTCLVVLLLCTSISAQAQYASSQIYDGYYMEYYAYESNVQDAFAASNPSPNAPQNISGRKNLWEGDGYGDNPLHPGDPLPLGDHTILFIFAAITAMIVFIQQRKRKHASSANQRLLTLAACIIATSTALAQNEGDYRLLYVEQTAISYTEIKVDYSIGSDIIPASANPIQDTVSLHIYNKVKEVGLEIFNGINNPEIILQQYTSGTWVDKECHMVFGPLQIKNGGSIIKLPGRKNAGSDSDIDDFVYDSGIPAIKDDTQDHACGVWNFVVVQDGSKATIDLDQTHRYEGDYYIRTASAEGGYNNYTVPGNLLQYYEYAYNNYGTTHDFTHSFCSNIPADGAVKFTIACDHSAKLAHDLLLTNDRFADDLYTLDNYVKNVSDEPVLPLKASVRFGWDMITNRLTRAYIAETKPVLNNEYLVIEGDITPSDTQFPGYFYDNTNWVYSVDVLTKPSALATVRAKYNSVNQYFWKDKALLGGSGSTAYPVRIIYDFKEHRFSTIYRPNGEITGKINLNTPVMIHREHNNPATQITFPTNDDKVIATGDDTEDKYTNPAYAVLTFLEDKFANDVTTTNHYEKMFYWVSFPFDVNLKDVYGLGAYGDYWAVQYYDGAKRAQQGLPHGTTGWEYVAKTKDEAATKVLKANTGYVVCLNYRHLSTDYGYAAGGGRKVSLYFPSANRVSPAEIKQQSDTTVNLAEYTNPKTTWNHHNWHLLGVPSYANPDFRTTQGDVPFFYQYWHPSDGYAAVASTEVDFYAMHAYMVQYAGNITWSGIVNTAPSGLAAKKNSSTIDKTMLRLELQQAGETMDKTFVQLREEEGTEGFDLNLDLTKIINKGANIYTVVNGDQMAGNVVPAQESIIPLGVVITEAGEYTFAMPSNSNGVTIELIDYEKGVSTNLLASDYTTQLPTGTFENRFALSIKPDKVTTSIEDTEAQMSNDNVRKLLIDGTLYLVKDGVIYDAQGKLVR